MKKKLEADLISIAHRILQLKNKSDINQLYLETQKLYEKLSVLRFVDEHFGDTKPTIGAIEIEKKIEEIFEQKESIQTEAPQAIEEIKEVEKIVETPLEQTPETDAVFSAGNGYNQRRNNFNRNNRNSFRGSRRNYSRRRNSSRKRNNN